MNRDPALDPVGDLDWDAERAAAFLDRAKGLWVEYLEKLAALPVARAWRPSAVREAVSLPVPREPLPDDELFEHLRSVIFDHSVYPGHPRFMGYITGAGTVPGAVADLVAAALNQSLGGWRHSPAATEIELHLTRWFASRFGLPATAGGMITSGGAMANFTWGRIPSSSSQRRSPFPSVASGTYRPGRPCRRSISAGSTSG